MLRFRALKCCNFLRAFSFFALTLVAMLPESKWLFKVVFNIEILFISIDGESQSLETLLFMSMGWDSLATLLLSISFISWSKIQTRVEDVSSAISIGVLRSTDRCVSIRDCCAGDHNSDCCVPLIDCCASETDNDWIFLRTFSFFVFTLAATLPEFEFINIINSYSYRSAIIIYIF